MKIVCVCGDDIVSSRERYFKIIDGVKKKNWEHIAITSEKRLSEQLVGVSLFGGDRLYSCDTSAKISVKDYEWISKHAASTEGSLLLYFGAAIPAAIKKLLPKDTKFEEFKLKKELFVLLDAIYPGNSRRVVTLFHEVIKTDAPELVLALLARQLRDMSMVKLGGGGAIPDWRRRKLMSQGGKFTHEALISFVNALAKADVDSKTGNGDLVTLLDIVFIKHL